MAFSGKFRHALWLLLCFVLTLQSVALDDNDPKLARWRMQEILKDISKTVETSFYDPKLNGVDWKASVEIARQRIDNADHLGEMVAAITGLLARLNDSHTVFIPPGRTEHAVFGFRAKPFGDDVLVYEVMPQGPADSAGLKVGDHVLAVNEFAATRANIDIMMRYFTFLNPNREMRVTISRPESGQREIVIKAELKSELSKDIFHLYDAYAHELEKEHEQMTKDYDGGIVYLRFPSFSTIPHDAGSFVGKAKNARAVILDLRENGGGRIETLEEMAGHFFNTEGKLGEFVGRDKTIPVQVNRRNPNIVAPLFVLVDSHSASASEMFARYIQLMHRGKIIGDRTSGRVNAARIVPGRVGSVYSIYYALEIAVGRVVMSDGEGLEGKGVPPDVLCVPTSNNLRGEKDVCLERALELARNSDSSVNAPTQSESR